MGETKFTRGKWVVDKSVPKKGYALINAPRWHGLAKVVVRMEGLSKNSEDGEANAHLIAAGPDLYEALSDLVGILELDTRSHVFDAVCSARAALARARGEAP